MADVDAVVIGSGAGGLAAAVALSRAGKKVLVLEQHELPGGWCHSFDLEGYSFSPGVHYIGELQPGGRMRAVYEGLGVADDLAFYELNPDGFDKLRIGRPGTPGAFAFDVPKGKDAFADRLKQRFPTEAAGIDGFFDLMTKMASELEAGTRLGGGLRGLMAIPQRIPTLARHGFTSLDRTLDRFTHDPVLRAILSIQAGDHGMPPSRCPTALHAAVIGHYFDGGWYPKGGARAIPKAFIKALRRNGGEIRVKTDVAKILVAGGRAAGVRLADGTEISADLVISNADPGVTFGRLVDHAHLSLATRLRLRRTTYSLSAISLFLASDIDARGAGLDSGNVWYIADPRVEDTYRYAADADPLARGDVPGTFLTATTLKDPTKRKDRTHTFESFAFVSYDAFARWAHSRYGDRPEGYAAMKEALADRMLKRIDEIVPGFSRHVTFRAVGTPLTNVHYCAATRGNLYGIEKRRSQVGPFSFGVRTEIPGLFLCGASTLGHGVAGATFSGVAAAKAALGCRTADLLTGTGRLTTSPADPEPAREARVA